MEKKKKKKLKKRLLTGFLSAAMAARIAHGNVEMPFKREELDAPIRIVYSEGLEPPVEPEEPQVMKAQEKKPQKTRLSMRSLMAHFMARLRGGEEEAAAGNLEAREAESRQVSPIRFLLQPFYPVVAFLAALFFSLVWPLPGLSSKIKEKFRSAPSYRLFSLIAKGLSVLLVLAIYFLIPSERRGWLYFFLILWAAVMLVLAIWTWLSKDRSESVIILVPDDDTKGRA